VTFARWVFGIAGVYGLLILTPMYFLEDRISLDQPPSITHPEYYYGFVGVAIAWQVAFLVISRDPVRYRLMMIPAIIEKGSYVIASWPSFRPDTSRRSSWVIRWAISSWEHCSSSPSSARPRALNTDAAQPSNHLGVSLRAASVLVLGIASGCAPSNWAASALLHPPRRPIVAQPAGAVDVVRFQGDGVALQGWRFGATGVPRGTIIFLHGVADNRSSGIGVAQRFVARGFDVIAYDSRANGESSGDACTYGYYEKRDLSRVIDTVATRPIVLLGHSLGAAVALQAASEDDRVTAVIGAETFSDLRTIARERAPFILSQASLNRAFARAEALARFKVDEVSPVSAAGRIRVPVLLIHGGADRETPADHSRRVFAALTGPKRLIIVPNAGHNGSLSGEIWSEIENWIDRVVSKAPPPIPRAAPPTDRPASHAVRADSSRRSPFPRVSRPRPQA
jgi:pimeloyl-ACP methyl ester carboxylesterase